MSLVMLDIVALLHPYIPHITEMLYGLLTGGEILITGEWPVTTLTKEGSSEDEMTRIFEVVRTIRNIRAESGIKHGELRDVILGAPIIYRDSLEENSHLIMGLTRASSVNLAERNQRLTGYAYGITNGIDIYVDASIDHSKIEEERTRLRGQIQEKKDYIRTLKEKLGNNAFVSNAPEKVVRAEMDKLHATESELAKIEEKFSHLKD